MIINNPLKMNDWKFSQFIKLVLSIQVSLWVIILLELNGINIPIISELIGFIYLTFIPGFLILRILKIHKLGNIKSVLYAVGLSILSVMFVGFALNMVFSLFGIYNPISIFPLITVMSIFVVILCIFSYLRDKDFSDTQLIDTSTFLSPILLFLCIIPFLAVFGTYFVNFYNNNLISMLLISLIAVIVILVAFDKIPKRLYPFTIWIIAISLLYDSSLISTYLWGWDIQNEYYLANTIFNNFYWDFTFGDAYNAMLSVIMLAPVYSIFINMDLVYVFKIIYILLFSLVPLGLYKVFKGQTNSKIAFLASFLFVSSSTFFMILPAEAREMIAELFLILLLLLIFGKKTNNSQVLFIIFGIGLVVSHYSSTYLFLFTIINVFIILILFYLYKWFVNSNDENKFFNFRKLWNSPMNIVTVTVIAIFTYLWYKYIAIGVALKALTDLFGFIETGFSPKLTLLIAKFGLINFYMVVVCILLILVVISFAVFKYRKNIAKKSSNIYNFNDFINPILQSKWKYHIFAFLSMIILVLFAFLVGKPQTWIVAVGRYLNFVLVFFTLTGLVLSFLQFTENRIKKEYFAFSIVSILVLLTGIFFPVFEDSFSITRIFQMTFIFLSPFCVIGGIIVFKSFFKSLNKSRLDNNVFIKVFSIFLLIFMFLNTGFFSVISNTSIPVHLSSESDVYPRFDVQETLGAQWLYKNRISDNIYADEHGTRLFKKYLYFVPVLSNYNGQDNSYIFARKFNQGDIFLLTIERGSKEKSKVYEDMSGMINTKNEIYDNGEAKSYFS